MPLRIEQSDWVVDNETLKKQFGYSGLTDDDEEHILQIHIDNTPNTILGGYHTHVCLLLFPNFINGDPGYVPAQLALDDNPVDSKIVTVRCGPCSDGALLIQPIDRDGSEAFLATLNKCQMMRLTLFGDGGAFMRLPIPNDEQFRRAARAYFSGVKGVSTQASMLGMLGKRQNLLSRLTSKLFS